MSELIYRHGYDISPIGFRAVGLIFLPGNFDDEAPRALFPGSILDLTQENLRASAFPEHGTNQSEGVNSSHPQAEDTPVPELPGPDVPAQELSAADIPDAAFSAAFRNWLRTRDFDGQTGYRGSDGLGYGSETNDQGEVETDDPDGRDDEEDNEDGDDGYGYGDDGYAHFNGYTEDGDTVEEDEPASPVRMAGSSTADRPFLTCQSVDPDDFLPQRLFRTTTKPVLTTNLRTAGEIHEAYRRMAVAVEEHARYRLVLDNTQDQHLNAAEGLVFYRQKLVAVQQDLDRARYALNKLRSKGLASGGRSGRYQPERQTPSGWRISDDDYLDMMEYLDEVRARAEDDGLSPGEIDRLVVEEAVHFQYSAKRFAMAEGWGDDREYDRYNDPYGHSANGWFEEKWFPPSLRDEEIACRQAEIKVQAVEDEIRDCEHKVSNLSGKLAELSTLCSDAEFDEAIATQNYEAAIQHRDFVFQFHEGSIEVADGTHLLAVERIMADRQAGGADHPASLETLRVRLIRVYLGAARRRLCLSPVPADYEAAIQDAKTVVDPADEILTDGVLPDGVLLDGNFEICDIRDPDLAERLSPYSMQIIDFLKSAEDMPVCVVSDAVGQASFVDERNWLSLSTRNQVKPHLMMLGDDLLEAGAEAEEDAVTFKVRSAGLAPSLEMTA